MLIPKHFKND